MMIDAISLFSISDQPWLCNVKFTIAAKERVVNPFIAQYTCHGQAGVKVSEVVADGAFKIQIRWIKFTRGGRWLKSVGIYFFVTLHEILNPTEGVGICGLL